jgi:hypothetical protein
MKIQIAVAALAAGLVLTSPAQAIVYYFPDLASPADTRGASPAAAPAKRLLYLDAKGNTKYLALAEVKGMDQAKFAGIMGEVKASFGQISQKAGPMVAKKWASDNADAMESIIEILASSSKVNLSADFSKAQSLKEALNSVKTNESSYRKKKTAEDVKSYLEGERKKIGMQVYN